MPLAPFTWSFRSVFGTLLLGLGLAPLAWVLVTLARTAWGFDLAMWMAQFAPPEWNLDPVTFGNRVINQLLPIGLAGGFLAILGLVLLVMPRRSPPRLDVIDRGPARIAIEATPPRVGERLQGSIYLGGRAEPGAIYKVALECLRDVSDDRSTAHRHEQEVQAVTGAQGPHLPFSFEVPITAPPTYGVVTFLGLPQRHKWRIHFVERGRWFADSFVVRMEPPLADAERIRIQRLAWKVLSWAILAYFAVFHALPFVVGEISGTNR